MTTAAIYVAAALAEITGCFAFWNWLRLGKPAFWAAGGLVCLGAFAALLTLTAVPAAGRAFAAYGGVYVACSLAWLWAVEGVRPDRWDLAGGAVCILGAAIVAAAPRA